VIAALEPVAVASRRRGGPPLRIAVLNYALPVPGRKWGGVDRVAHELADALARRGHSVTVFAHDPRPAGAQYSVEALPWRRFVSTWLGRRVTMGYLGNLLMLRVPTDGYDVAIVHGDSLLFPLAGLPFVRVVHGTALQEATSATSIGRFVLQSGIYLQELLSAATHRATVGVSHNTAAYNPFVRRVIANGVNRDVFHPDESARHRTPSLVFVGTLTGRKRGQWLLDAFKSIIRPAVPNAELHMVSAPGAPCEGVTYHEGVSDVVLAGLYRQAWLYVSPSTYEGFGLPYLEALACGTPVVATPNPGSREVQADGGGVQCGDADLASTTIRLLQDGAARRALARAGLQIAARYDLTSVVDAYEALLWELANHRPRKASDGR
jgi:phosphatidylinositol alpha-mannosyltransferase